MTILCGIDFSDCALTSARVAAGIARRLAVPLRLVHATELPRLAMEQEGGTSPRLDALAERLRAEFGIGVETVVATGAADERIVELAREADARLVVVGSLGNRSQHRWLLGSVAERVAQASTRPVLVVREGASLAAWARGEATLRVMVGVECTPVSLSAFGWAGELAAVAPVELTVARIVWPPELQQAGVPGPIPLDHLPPELDARLRRELAEWAGAPPPSVPTSFVVKPGWGRVDSHLTQLAESVKADLLVVGTHQRAGIARLWQGSVSRGVLHGAAMNVACVPRV